jgi:hypothetical protein
MNIQLYTQLFIIGLVGILFHVFVIKLPSVKEASRVANKSFSVKEYLSDDWIALCGSIVTLVACILFVDEILKWKPAIIDYIKFLFFFIGYTGSSVLLAVLSQATKKINKVVDIKTDKADGK